jgi:hypothetical protein
MADRYQNRHFPADDRGQGSDQHRPGPGESDPLAELARLIGQTDPFGNPGRINQPAPPAPAGAVPRERYRQPQYGAEPPQLEEEPAPAAGPPPWMQRANAKVAQREGARDVPAQQDHLPPVHPLHRHTQPAPPEEAHVEEPAYQERELDTSRYDDALYGQIEKGAQDYQRLPAYPDDPYAYQDDDGAEAEAEEPGNRRRGAVVKLVALLALAVIGTGSALAYRTYVASKSSGEPPIIKADNSPTKVVPAPSDNTGKTPDRMAMGDGTEKLVSREEAPVDINARAAGPRVVFPPLSPNASPPPPSSVSTATMAPATTGATPTNGTLPNNEPRKIKTLSVRGDQADSGGAAAPVAAPPPASPPPATKPVAAAKGQAATRAVAPSANAPVSLAPDGAQTSAAPAARVATTTNPAPATSSAASSGGGLLVSVSSQQSEADAQNSYRALQGKFPAQLGSHSPVIKRTDLGDKVVYRAMVGPFGSREEATQFCVDYKAAGGQCFVPRN